MWLIMAAGLGMPVQAETELFTNVYVVPPTILNRILNAPSAKSVLEAAGIAFPEGASAIYNAATSQLIVRNTEDQMKLVETYVETIRDKVEKQIYVTVKEARFRGELVDLLKSHSSGPTAGNAEIDTLIAKESDEEIGRFFHLTDAALDLPNKVSVFDSRESFQRELSRPPTTVEEPKAPRRIGMTGALTDSQYQIVIRRLAQIRGIDLESLPSVMIRSAQPGMSRQEDRRCGFIAVLGADEFTIDLELFLPEAGKAFYDAATSNFEPTASVTIWDGQTVVLAEKTANGENRLVFITAALVDPAGMPLKPKPAAAAPDESKAK
jgi:hypothetical protein